MKTYELIIKSHTDAPDFEVTVEAESVEEAIKNLQSRYDLSREVIGANLMVQGHER